VKDWKSIAKANGLDLSPQELDRIAKPLGTLDEAFQPLVQDLPPDLEPSFEFRTGEDAQ
jgi:hypothetical protein